MYISKEPLYGNSKSRFIVISDTKIISGVKLMKTIIKLYCKEAVKVHVLCYDSFVDEFLFGLNVDHSNLNVLNAFSDPCGWSSLENISSNLLSVDFLIEKYLNCKGVICVYSLTPLLIHNSVDNVYRALHKLLKKNEDIQLLTLVHSDVHDSIENNKIERLASTVLHVLPDDKNHLRATIRYTSGKVSTQLVKYDISACYEFSILSDVNLQIKRMVTKQPDPTANLTFNLRLKDDEKEARNQLQLPYMKMQNDENSEQNLVDDLYDEEDPDDDLDI